MQIVLDRYYRTLYESLMDRRLVTSSKQALYLNLLFKSMKSDTNIARVKAFIKRIIQVTSMHSPGFTCGVLFLLAELTTSRPELKSLWAESTVVSEYDPRKRDPLYANADSSSLWEISPLLQHYHPTVQLYAENLLNAQPNTAKPDLALHTVKHFLDRFVYRNPKTKATTRGASIMQPLPGTDTSLILGIRGNATTERAVNSEEWWRQQVDRIRPDEVFFHKFFVLKEESEVRALGRKRKRGGEDDDLDEDEIWEALVKSSKEEGGVGDVDIDDDDSVDWSDEDELDEDGLGEMNEGMSDLDEMDEDMSDMEGDVDDDEDMSGEEGDVNDFFDDEAEEVGSDDEKDEELEDASLDESAADDSDEDGSDGVEGRFEFGDSASDIMDSDEDIEVPVQQATADRSKKRKLKNLPTFASAEDYADMLED
jgi:ribosome biogenesis protein MAK21